MRTMLEMMMMMMLVISTKSHIILIVAQRYQGTQFQEKVQRSNNNLLQLINKRRQSRLCKMIFSLFDKIIGSTLRFNICYWIMLKYQFWNIASIMASIIGTQVQIHILHTISKLIFKHKCKHECKHTYIHTGFFSVRAVFTVGNFGTLHQ